MNQWRRTDLKLLVSELIQATQSVMNCLAARHVDILLGNNGEQLYFCTFYKLDCTVCAFLYSNVRDSWYLHSFAVPTPELLELLESWLKA